MNDHRLGLIYTFVSAVAWSTAGLFTRILGTLDPFSILMWRGVFGGMGLVAVLLAMEGRQGLKGFARLGGPGWLYAVLSAVGMIAMISSMTLTSVAHNAIIYATVPFMAAGLGWWMLGERPGAGALIAAGFALAGAAISVGAGSDGHLSGDLLALLMTVTMALMMVIGRRHRSIPTLAAAATSAFLASAAALPLAATPWPGAGNVAILLAFGLANSSVGLALFLMGSARIAPVETALIGALDAPLAPLWVWIAFAEVPGPATLWGGAIVLTAVLGHILASARPSPAQAAPPP